MAVLSFVFITALVAALTFWFTRGDDHSTDTGYFLAGRSLTWPLIAGSMLLTNLSTEQIVGLNGAAYVDGLAVMAWEVVAVVTLVLMALFFLPRFLQKGVATVPQYLAIRFDRQTQLMTNLVFLLAYAVILLPIILYTGATALIAILDIEKMLGLPSHQATLWTIVWLVGLIGSVYALFGGLRTVAVSDFLNGIGLLAGGFMITWFALRALGDGHLLEGLEAVADGNANRLNSLGGSQSSVPFGTLFTGVLLLNLFYWTTNQQIIQRTFGARSLSEGQKGVLATALLKLLGPFYLVLPGLIAYAMFRGQGVLADHSYGLLVRTVLPAAYSGFFAAVLMGAILSSYNSALNSACTLFSLGIYKRLRQKKDEEGSNSVRAAKIFGWIIAIISMSLAPLLSGQQSIFVYLQKMNGIYFIPIFAIVVVGMLSRTVSAFAAKTALLTGIVVIAAGYFIPPLAEVVGSMHEFHFLGLVFLFLILIMLVQGSVRPHELPPDEADVNAVDMTPWRHARSASMILVVIVILIYAWFADLSVLGT